MLTLLHLLSAIALLVWGTHIVRTGIMRVYGASLRRVLSESVEKKPWAFMAGIGVTALVQSSNATALLTTSFVSQRLVALAPALVIILGADVGTALMVRILTFDFSWLSPLLIFLGVIFFLSRKQTRVGQIGRVAIGLGLILLALEMIVAAATPITQTAGVKVLFSSLTGDIMLDALVGALFAVVSYSSLAAVLLTATLTASGVISLEVAMCLVIGANLGSGLLIMIGSTTQNAAGRRVALGSVLFKLIGCLFVLPFVEPLSRWLARLPLEPEELVIYFHLFYNLIRCLILIPFAEMVARLSCVMIADSPEVDIQMRPRHLDTSALDTPALALTNAARETLRIGDVVEQMLRLYREVLQGDPMQRREIRRLDDDVDVLYTAIKLYLAQIQKDSLDERDSRRWAEVIEVALNLEQAGDIIERMADDVANTSLTARRAFSAQGLTELNTLHDQLLANLRLGLSVFLSEDITSAKRLRRAKHRFRILNRRYAHAHVDRLHQQNVQSLETSSLHLGLLGDMNRLNSLFCAVAYNVLTVSQDEDEEREESPLTL
ncbi:MULTISPECIES: Na/Pi cotransporter family protein [unclassified Brenneria]|uniref:Na/Pi cotransporter family protein n=1 Tax=unclassified Brenneria TaxID=2634434 RepID=UPI0015546001|nr:Na/Pi cotransporter family protein [Brenneria sp. L3-3C-1]MEE3644700.1 Na/Pi cotransporter family protein [Brenneria sp. L3_3C_1]MEE3652675.1 Na/Pi cotransporter family protein [Brenneria sp. HEZEL_4_2_4]NPD02633.1 Na/Pi cotransporter family protein [Brenneria sp. hezel4-2-4]